MLRIAIAASALIVSSASITTVQAQIADRKVITLEGARNIVAAAEAEAMRNGWTVTIVVTDAAGEPIVLQRMDGAPHSSLDLAAAKARTAARFRRPTKALDESVSAGRVSLLSLEGFAFVEGGEPVTVGTVGFPPFGEVVGDGMAVVDSLYGGYGEGAPRGLGPRQDSIRLQGEPYLAREFPLLDRIVRARIVQR